MPVDSWTLSGVLLGVLSALLTLLVATVALYTDHVPLLLRQGAGVLAPPLRALRTAHSGHLGDYVVWLLLSVTLLTIGIAAS
jgi:multicomponent Na+:H+ antiporter subunit D